MLTQQTSGSQRPAKAHPIQPQHNQAPASKPDFDGVTIYQQINPHSHCNIIVRGSHSDQKFGGVFFDMPAATSATFNTYYGKSEDDKAGKAKA